jgi:uncharacterized membrane protein
VEPVGLFGGILGVFFVLFIVAFVAVFAIIIGVWVMILWRGSRGVEDPAVTELKRRLADGEISPVEYQARLDTLRREH